MTLSEQEPRETRKNDTLFHEEETPILRKRDLMRTATGIELHVLTPDSRVIRIKDIALSMARQCRSAGHLREDIEIFSTAQHCVLMSYVVPEGLALAALLSDATDAYLQHMLKQVRQSIIGGAYTDLRRRWAREITYALVDYDARAERAKPEAEQRRPPTWNLNNPHPDVVRADKVLLATERRDLCLPYDGWRNSEDALPEPLLPLLPLAASAQFLARFAELCPNAPARLYAPSDQETP